LAALYCSKKTSRWRKQNWLSAPLPGLSLYTFAYFNRLFQYKYLKKKDGNPKLEWIAVSRAASENVCVRKALDCEGGGYSVLSKDRR